MMPILSEVINETFIVTLSLCVVKDPRMVVLTLPQVWEGWVL